MRTFHFNRLSHQTTLTSQVHKQFVSRDRGPLSLIHIKTCVKPSGSAIQSSENPRHKGSIPKRVMETRSQVRLQNFFP